MSDTNVQVSVECTLFLAGSGSAVGMTSITGIGTGSSPTFTEVPGVQNVNLNLSKNESDVSVRGAGGIKLIRGAQKDVSIDVTYPYVRGDTVREALFTAWWNGTHVGVAALDGPIASALSKGFAMDMEVISASLPEPIEGVLVQSFTLKPCYPGADSSGTLTKPCIIAGSAGGSLTLGTTI
jgi:hypothetical protein